MIFDSRLLRKEFACKCGCGRDTVDHELYRILLDARIDIAAPMTINSGYRCWHHNRVVGGKAHSFHLDGRAADFTIRGMSPIEVYQYFDSRYPDLYGMIAYRSFVHIDTGDRRYRSVFTEQETQDVRT